MTKVEVRMTKLEDELASCIPGTRSPWRVIPAKAGIVGNTGIPLSRDAGPLLDYFRRLTLLLSPHCCALTDFVRHSYFDIRHSNPFA